MVWSLSPRDPTYHYPPPFPSFSLLYHLGVNVSGPTIQHAFVLDIVALLEIKHAVHVAALLDLKPVAGNVA